MRADFPILRERVHGKPLVYLDNANTSQKPQAVIDARSRRLLPARNANIHRGVHLLSERRRRLYEGARAKARGFINAPDREIDLPRGTTDGINLVAQTYGRMTLRRRRRDRALRMEHHSNIVPWQILCEQTGATLRVAPINDRGEIDLDEYERCCPRARRSSPSATCPTRSGRSTRSRDHRSRARAGAVVLVDGAQAATTRRRRAGARLRLLRVLEPQDVRADRHRRALRRRALLEAMPPYQGGGDMIASVTFEKTTYNVVPYKFEAGTPNIAGVVGSAPPSTT